MALTLAVMSSPELFGRSRHSGEWLLDVVADLVWMSVEKAAEAARTCRASSVPRGGVRQVLHPGPDTPLWNSLVERMQPHLAKWGTKAVLARELEVPRQRVNDYFVARTRMPDGERMLRVLTWLIQQETVAGELTERAVKRAKARAAAGDAEAHE